MIYSVVTLHFNKNSKNVAGGLSLTRHVKQQLEVCLLTSVRSSVVTNWTSLSVLCNNVKGKIVEAQKQYVLRFVIATEKGRPGFNLRAP